jgi:hypothetical protein
MQGIYRVSTSERKVMLDNATLLTALENLLWAATIEGHLHRSSPIVKEAEAIIREAKKPAPVEPEKPAKPVLPPVMLARKRPMCPSVAPTGEKCRRLEGYGVDPKTGKYHTFFCSGRNGKGYKRINWSDADTQPRKEEPCQESHS